MCTSYTQGQNPSCWLKDPASHKVLLLKPRRPSTSLTRPRTKQVCLGLSAKCCRNITVQNMQCTTGHTSKPGFKRWRTRGDQPILTVHLRLTCQSRHSLCFAGCDVFHLRRSGTTAKVAGTLQGSICCIAHSAICSCCSARVTRYRCADLQAQAAKPTAYLARAGSMYRQHLLDICYKRNRYMPTPKVDGLLSLH